MGSGIKSAPMSPTSRRTAEEPATPYHFAAHAFARAEFDHCKQFLRICESTQEAEAEVSGADLLRARLARAEGDLETWYTTSRKAERLAASAGDRMTAVALRALSAKRLGKVAEASKLFAQLETAFAAAAPSDAVYARYLVAADAWEDRDLTRAEMLANKNIAATGDPESLALLGWIEVRRERYRLAGTYFIDALTQLRESDRIDVRLQARLIHAAAVVASETIDLRMGRRVRREYDELKWPQSLRVERFNACTCLRFLALLEGDLELAWVLSREAVGIAPRPGYVAIAETNAAIASRLLGDDRSYRLQLARAWNILRHEKLGSAHTEERVALTNFMIEAGRALPTDARKAAMLYGSLSAKVDRSNALEEDRRVTAFEAFAAGRVYEGLGQRAAAIRKYRRSLELWSELKFGMRAALVALDLGRLTRDKRYRSPIDAALKRAPKAWFARVAAAGTPELIWPVQREVLSQLLQGRSAKAIAAHLKRSPFTVTNHTRKLFAAFDVHSRDELRSRCAELGVTPASLQAPL